eukprot:CAMPEP_0113302080 /NCGR_PEP_ID=MMETSP0010_2-20120614/3043_1 /TAXON_ID=216773 ORGANISM="Corethron hystrix, Strain 308" /NCGR_SAMPLE_ID=MMETSP0010_2 /ASSEMBLY_ACC=CAM_ASM_000155 /LENGTH=271 /DNA_ID=CAMNT_0000155813 /DNA_START=336 /DNA_END=1151 /DNA_ORIENTATION=+ /assembly_acc=CAM_ASM_000155
MIDAASKAINDAREAGKTRQIVRVLLPRDPTGSRLGTFAEGDANGYAQFSNAALVPPDETWQGGIMQLYRAAGATCREILRAISPNPGGLPPRTTEDVSVDPSGVDGMGLWTSESTSPSDDAACFVQPTIEITNAIESVHKQAGSKRLVFILNPQWRNVDDALDAASKVGGFFGSVASFLGGKGGALKRLNEMGFESTFTIEGYVCKGTDVRLMKRFDSDWAVFALNDMGDGYVSLGTSLERPTYQDVDEMMDEKGIALKYARDIGLADKL